MILLVYFYYNYTVSMRKTLYKSRPSRLLLEEKGGNQAFNYLFLTVFFYTEAVVSVIIPYYHQP